jgi:hypothetical protein
MIKKETITMIYPANVMQAWPHVSLLLEPAVIRDGTHDIDDVRKQILGGQAQLWVQWTNSFDAAVVTEFMNYPKGLWFRFWLAGARYGADVKWEAFFDTLVNFAKENKCHGIEDCGRSGWSKYCPKKVRNIGVMRRMELGGSNV